MIYRQFDALEEKTVRDRRRKATDVWFLFKGDKWPEVTIDNVIDESLMEKYV